MYRSMQSCKTSGCMSSVGDSGTLDRHFAGCRGFSGILEFRMKTENLETLKDQLKFGGFDLFLISNMRWSLTVETCSCRLAIGDLQLETCKWRLAVLDLQLEICN